MKPTTPLQPLIQANVKPPSPMLAPKQHPLKPATPIQAKNAPKTPNSHPQRRCRFHLRLGQHPQRRCRFQSHTSTSAQRRWRFQTSGPSGLQDPDAIPMGGGRAWPDNESTRRAHISDPAPPVWRAPEGPEGQATTPVDSVGAWSRCRWVAAGPGRASRSTTPSRQARVWRSRGRAAAHRHSKRPGPQVRQA